MAEAKPLHRSDVNEDIIALEMHSDKISETPSSYTTVVAEDNVVPPTTEVASASEFLSPPNSPEHIYISHTLTPLREILLILTICTTMFTAQLGLSQTLSLIHIIGRTYSITQPGDLSWLVAGYSLTVGTFILMAGRLGDHFGHKRIYLIGTAWYALWSIIAGLAVYSKYFLFVFSRVMQGIGPAITLPNALAILGMAYKVGGRKNMAFAVFGGAAPFGAMAGFVTGGLWALVWWPWAYWTSGIALVGIALVSAWVIPDGMGKPRDQKNGINTWRSLLVELDVLGSLLGVTALVLVNLAWNQATLVGWGVAYVYVSLIMGLGFGLLFFWVELAWATRPILPVAAFTADIAFVLACTACGWASYGIWVFYTANLAVELRGASPLLLAAWYSPVILSGLLSALAVGKLLGHLSPAWMMVIGMVAYTLGSLLIATMPAQQTYWGQLFFSVLIMCVGMDSSFPAATLIVSNAMPPEYQGVGASLVTTVVNYSISLGLGFAGTVDREVSRGHEADLFRGYRGAFYMELGLAVLGLGLSLLFVLKGFLEGRRKKGEGAVDVHVESKGEMTSRA